MELWCFKILITYVTELCPWQRQSYQSDQALVNLKVGIFTRQVSKGNDNVVVKVMLSRSNQLLLLSTVSW